LWRADQGNGRQVLFKLAHELGHADFVGSYGGSHVAINRAKRQIGGERELGMGIARYRSEILSKRGPLAR